MNMQKATSVNEPEVPPVHSQRNPLGAELSRAGITLESSTSMSASHKWVAIAPPRVRGDERLRSAFAQDAASGVDHPQFVGLVVNVFVDIDHLRQRPSGPVNPQQCTS